LGSTYSVPPDPIAKFDRRRRERRDKGKKKEERRGKDGKWGGWEEEDNTQEIKFRLRY